MFPGNPRANFLVIGDLSDLNEFAAFERALQQAFDDLVFRAPLKDPKSGDEFFRLGKRTVGHDWPSSRVRDADSSSTCLQAFGCQQDPVADKRLIERHHSGGR
ncbi:MAG: hypothetical protein WCA52_09450 [Candidatus Aquilonibacter sp.]